MNKLAEKVLSGLDIARGRLPGTYHPDQIERMAKALEYAGVNATIEPVNPRIVFLREIHAIRKDCGKLEIAAAVERGYTLAEISQASGVGLRAIQRRYHQGTKPKPNRVLDSKIIFRTPHIHP